MTRINLVPPRELSDQHLLAEIRELPRIFSHVQKYGVHPEKIPKKFTLGKGHVLFFTDKFLFLFRRYMKLYKEYVYNRKFNLSYNYNDVFDKYNNIIMHSYDWKPTQEDIELSRARIQEKIAMKPDWYRWTK